MPQVALKEAFRLSYLLPCANGKIKKMLTHSYGACQAHKDQNGH